MRLGKLPRKYDHRTLQLPRYLPRLPAPPPFVDHASRLPTDVGMYGNDEWGDCVVAGAAHRIQSWSIYAERGILSVPESAVLAAYHHLSPNDTGLNILDFLNYWRKTGLAGEKIEAFAEAPAGSLEYLKLCIQHFGGAYIGVSLPGTNTFGPWLDVSGPPNPQNGHLIDLSAYDDSAQLFRCETWGEVRDVSYRWLQRYNDESWAILDDISLIQSSGRSPEGFDWAALQDDLAHLGDPVVGPGPVPGPPPGPGPTPDPGPSPCQAEFAELLDANPHMRPIVRRWLARARALTEQ